MEKCHINIQRLDGEFHLNNRDMYIITIGFIILGLGVALLNLGESVTFFIFPFFFAGDLAPVFVISTLFIMMMACWWVNKNWSDAARFSHSLEPRQAYLRVDVSCQFCGNSCGNSVEQEFGDNESL